MADASEKQQVDQSSFRDESHFLRPIPWVETHGYHRTVAPRLKPRRGRFAAAAVHHWSRSVPEIFLVVFDFMPTKQFHEFFLKRFCRVMFALL